jgi:hypothetical protein
MLSSICFDLRPLITQAYSTLTSATEYSKNEWPITSGDAVFHANYRNLGIIVERRESEKYVFV